MPVKKKKTFIKKTTETKGMSEKPNKKEIVTEEIETTEQVAPENETMEMETKVIESPQEEVQDESKSEIEQISKSDEESLESKDDKDLSTENIEEVPSRLEQIAEEQSNESESNSPRSKFLWGVIPVVLIAIAIIGGFFVYNVGVKNGKDQAIKTMPTPKPTDITPTEAESSLTEFSIEVLNGSGVSGEAAKVSDLLTSAGFDVSSTGNADSKDYEKTVIQVKDKVAEQFVKSLMKELEKTYELDKTEILEDSETSDVIVIVGSSTVE